MKFTFLAAFTLVLLVSAFCQSFSGIAELNQAKNFRFSSTDPDWRHGNVDFRPILPGKTFTMADIKGPGDIRRIWLTILPSEPGYSRLMTLRIYWDGEQNPSVECPLGDFFGVGHGLEENVDSLPVRVSADGRARSCFWVMPFRKSARITLTNEGRLATWCFYYQVDGTYEPVKPDAPYFHASYRQQFPCRPGANYVIADIQGRGNYVGSVVSARSTSDGWFGEGNDYFFVDGDAEPTLRGTGFEDFFGQAWGLSVVGGIYSGCTVSEDLAIGGRASCYRWHVADPVHFEKGLRVELQHMGVGKASDGAIRNNVERPDEFSSAAFWYQIGKHAPYPPLPCGYDRMPFDYRNFIEAETTPNVTSTGGSVRVNKINGLHGDAELEWSDAATGNELNFPFSVPKSGQHQLMVLVSKQNTGGRGQFLIDGKPVSAKISFYHPGFAMHQEIPLEMGELTAGHHTLTLRCLPKAPEAEEGNWFGIDGFILQPLRP
jgi:hypothetical protein